MRSSISKSVTQIAWMYQPVDVIPGTPHESYTDVDRPGNECLREITSLSSFYRQFSAASVGCKRLVFQPCQRSSSSMSNVAMRYLGFIPAHGHNQPWTIFSLHE